MGTSQGAQAHSDAGRPHGTAPGGPPAAAAKPWSLDAYCRTCDKQVRPDFRNGWGRLFTLVTLLEFVAVVMSVVACFTSVSPGGGVQRTLATWPAAIHPAGFGVAAAVAAALAAQVVAGALTRRACRVGTCPACQNPVHSQDPTGQTAV